MMRRVLPLALAAFVIEALVVLPLFVAAVNWLITHHRA